MIRLWRRWVSVVQRREGGESLALFRIAMGACVLLTVLTLVKEELVSVVWLDAAHGGYRATVHGNWLIRLLGGVTPGVVWSLVGVSIVAGAALVVGVWARVAALVAGQSVIALTRLNYEASGSYDLMLTNALWLLVLSQSAATLSLSCRIKRGAWVSDTEVPAWPRYLIVFQLVAVYASTGLQKMSIHWMPLGDLSALHYILQQPSWQRFNMDWMGGVYWLTQLATLVTWVWELTAPLLLVAMYFRATCDRGGRLRSLFNRVRFVELFVAIGVVMHLGTWVLMDVGIFTWVALAYYPCIIEPRAWRALGRHVVRRQVTATAPSRSRL